MSKRTKNIKVGIAQAEPALFDLEAGLAKVASYTKEMAGKGASLALFPEAYLPGYPWGMGFGTVVGNRSPTGRDQWLLYWENAVELPGPAVDQLGTIARSNNVYLVIGVIEKDRMGGTLFCTILYFSPTGALIGKHRKIKPTAAERIIWGEGAGDDLTVYDLPIGRIGGLICWENYMPLARYALYEQGVQIYLAPTADQRPSWQATMKHIACEGRCFVIGCNQYVTKSMFPEAFRGELRLPNEVVCRGGSLVVSPLGNVVAGPLYDQAGVLIAELNLDEVAKGKMDFDVIGHYARPDIFQYNYKKYDGSGKE